VQKAVNLGTLKQLWRPKLQTFFVGENELQMGKISNLSFLVSSEKNADF
jgi:hypothetical protein